MKKNTAYLTVAAVIGALYASLTLLGGAFGISYGAVQFRFAEALCVLPLFTPAAVPGLAVGCLAANLLGANGPLDAVMGTTATFLAAVFTRKFRHITVRRYPLPSFLSPVLINGIFVGAEITLLSTRPAALTVLIVNTLTVMAGEGAVMFIPGTALYMLIKKNAPLQKVFKQQTAERRRNYPCGTPQIRGKPK